MQARIAALWRFPIKACAAESVPHLDLDAEGWPEGDRAWAVINEQGELTWMGSHPRLAQVHSRLTPQGLHLWQVGQSEPTAAEPGAALRVRAWNPQREDFDVLDAQDGGDAAAALLQAATGAPLRLVRLAHAAQRRPGTNALHLVGDGSLAAWAADSPVPATDLDRRTRANIVLTGADGTELPPFLEELATDLQGPGLHLQRTEPCLRCVVPGLDPHTGEARTEILDALNRQSLQRLPGRPVQFGVYVRATGAGRLQVGDELTLELDFN